MHFKIGSEAYGFVLLQYFPSWNYTINDRTLHWTPYSTEQLFLIHFILFCSLLFFFILKPMSIEFEYLSWTFFFFLLTYSIILCFVLNFFWEWIWIISYNYVFAILRNDGELRIIINTEKTCENLLRDLKHFYYNFFDL